LKRRNTVNESEVKYKEWIPINLFVTISISLFIVLLVSAIIMTITLDPYDKVFTISLCSILALFFLLIGINYRGIEITITKEEIIVRFGLHKKKISIDNITSFEATKASFKKYLGFGVRFGNDSSLAFTTGFGDAVKLSTEENRPFVFSTKNPEEICDLLTELSKQE